jgi:outer membrane lipoprotein carrier protein
MTFILSLFFATSAVAETTASNVDKLVSEIESTYRPVSSIEADFVQITKNPSLKMEIEQKGHMYISRPKKIRWNFQKPSEKSFISNGSSLWVWDPALNQAIKSTDLGDNDMMSLLEDLSSIDEHFEIELAYETEDDFQLRLKPKSEASFRKLNLKFSKKNKVLKSVEVEDAVGGEVDLQFTNLSFNPELAPETFDFQPPEGAEVIDGAF